MTSVLFPTFVALARVLPPRLVPGVLALFTVGECYLAARFFLWRGPF